MEAMGSRVSDNESVLMTICFCWTCGNRLVHSAPNPRFTPAPKTVVVQPSPYRKKPPVDEEAA